MFYFKYIIFFQKLEFKINGMNFKSCNLANIIYIIIIDFFSEILLS